MWRWMLGAEIPFCLLWMGLLLFTPESPAWLIYKGRIDDAKQKLQSIMPEGEIDAHVVEVQNSLEKSSSDRSIMAQLAEIFSKPMRLTLVIAFTIAVAQQASGINGCFVLRTDDF